MKKRLMGMAAALLAIGMLTGCGSGFEEDVALNEMKVEQFVTLGDYENIAVDVPDAEVDQDEWDQLLLAVYRSYVTDESTGVTDRPVREGDTVIIDYVGTENGVAFSGGTASDASLQIGSNSFIPGFESGLVGVMPGETVELNLTFPENFRNEERAGKQVVFTVTVKYIIPEMNDMRDSVVAAQNMEAASNVEELRQYVYNYLKESAEQARIYNMQNAIIQQLTETSTIAELPDSVVERYRDLIRDSIERAAANLNTTADIYANYYYGMNCEDYVFLAGEIQARQELILQAIANEQGLAISDEELEPLIEDYALAMGFTAVADLEAIIPREQLRNYFMSDRVMNYLVELADKNR